MTAGEGPADLATALAVGSEAAKDADIGARPFAAIIWFKNQKAAFAAARKLRRYARATALSTNARGARGQRLDRS
jgi:hypothetical protein